MTKKSGIQIHQGSALKRISDLYPKVLDSILEYIQNAIDAGSSKIWVSINTKNRTASIADNGSGVSVSDFEKALKSILKSQKTEGALGQFGMGMISALCKCDHFTITSSPNSSNAYNRWSFVSADLINLPEIDGIPYEPQPKLFFSNTDNKQTTKREYVNWRTKVIMTGLTRDRIIGKITVDELKSAIVDKYNEALLARGTIIDINVKDGNNSHHLEVVGKKFSGQKIPTTKVESKDCGKVLFDLYIAPKHAGARRGKVLVGVIADLFRISFKQFGEKHRDLISPETMGVLNSGIFEGNILSEFCKLDPGRKSLIENDALVEFILQIERWCQETGHHLMSEIDDSKDDELYQRTGLKAMLTVEQLVKDNPALLELIKSSQFGTIGSHHAEKTSAGTTDEKLSSTQGIKPEGGSQTKQSAQVFTLLPKNDHPKHTPFTVGGPGGRTRKIVKGHSTGLRFVFSEMPGNNNLWEYDRRNGCLTFNVRHPLWTEAETRDLLLARFIEVITIKALTLELMPAAYKNGSEEFIKQELPLTLKLLKNMLPKTGGLGKISKQAINL